jgi:glyoxalase family protein
VYADADCLSLLSRGDTRVDYLYLLPDITPGTAGYESAYHVAFRVPDRKALRIMLEHVQASGMPCSGEVDHFYFRSVYFREPGGMLFEIATDASGFRVDEAEQSLGQALKLTVGREYMRSAIAAELPALIHPDTV